MRRGLLAAALALGALVPAAGQDAAPESCADSAGDGSCGAGDIFDEWRPWDDGSEPELDAEFASDSDQSNPDSCRSGTVVKERNVPLSVGLPRVKSGANLEVFVALNGLITGVIVQVEDPRCLGTLAQVAAEELAGRAVDDTIIEPKRLLSNTGRPVRSWDDISLSDFYVHVLLDREEWVWPGIRVGFSWTVAGRSLRTVAMSPRVILVEDMVSDEESEHLIKAGSHTLFRSPEKHYSTDPKYQNYRTSETGYFPGNDQVAAAVRRRAWQVLRLRKLNMVENLQLLRYVPGRWYKEHYDLFNNVPAITKADEQVELYLLSRELVSWAAQQRRLLYLAWREGLMHGWLHTRPNSQAYPDIQRPDFFKVIGADRADDLVEVHMAWIRAAFCSNKYPLAAEKACVLEAAEVLDMLQDKFPEEFRHRAIQRNRHVTLLPYLTEVEEGGETVFPLAGNSESLFGLASNIKREGMNECSSGIYVPPIKGAAAMFYHTRPDSTDRDPLSMHGGCPPVTGIKYAINIFCWNINNALGTKHVNV